MAPFSKFEFEFELEFVEFEFKLEFEFGFEFELAFELELRLFVFEFVGVEQLGLSGIVDEGEELEVERRGEDEGGVEGEGV